MAASNNCSAIYRGVVYFGGHSKIMAVVKHIIEHSGSQSIANFIFFPPGIHEIWLGGLDFVENDLNTSVFILCQSCFKNFLALFPFQVTTITFGASPTPPQARLLSLAVTTTERAFGIVRGCRDLCC